MADYNSAYTGAEIDQGVGNGLAAPTTYAPKAHDDANTTYGKGTDTKYGHLKLSASTSSTSGTSDGIAATPSAVKAAYDLANGKQSPATTLAGYGITDAASSADLGTFVRPNILDNGYFVGGGSQQGGGQFPINQLGDTAYNSSGYCIDRWQIGINNAMSVQTDCIQISDSTGNHQTWKILTQKIPNVENFRGKKMTMSILCGGTVTSELAKPLIRIENNGTYVDQRMGGFLEANGLATLTWTIPTSGTFDMVVAGIMHDATKTGSYKIIAMKLELGDSQTLAHQENGVWVLNEIPNYEEQLARCQRYQIELNSAGSQYTALGVGSGYSATRANVAVSLPVTMRTRPVLKTSGTFTVTNFATSTNVTSFNLYRFGGSHFTLECNVASGLTQGDDYVLETTAATDSFLLDANL